MKQNRKIWFSVLVIIVILIIFVSCLFKKNHNVLCELKRDSLTTKINIELNKNITFSYDYTFDSMDKTVDKYDSINSYLKMIEKNNGVNVNLEQLGYNVNYSINIDLNKISEDDYQVLNVTELIKFKNSEEIVKYYEEQGFVCEII